MYTNDIRIKEGSTVLVRYKANGTTLLSAHTSYTFDIEVKNPTLTYYYFYKFIENYTGVKTLIYSQIEPFSQILSLPGSQNNNTRLYTKPYDITLDYLDILKNSQSRKIESFDLRQNQDTSSLEELFKTVDDEITKRKSEGNTNIWVYELDELFNEKRSIKKKNINHNTIPLKTFFINKN